MFRTFLTLWLIDHHKIKFAWRLAEQIWNEKENRV